MQFRPVNSPKSSAIEISFFSHSVRILRWIARLRFWRQLARPRVRVVSARILSDSHIVLSNLNNLVVCHLSRTSSQLAFHVFDVLPHSSQAIPILQQSVR